ncbi:right-handed parallel beta-helix repeat-containing protein, partial [Candidatus Bipolaricaulota bacterium]|nr:right-handed parallel beta-helix repeat-containing protein [Candidatus Bipolaricaulota bacterium]
VPHKVIIETTDWRQSPVSVQTGASQVRLKGLDIVGSGGERCTRTGTSKCSAGVEVSGDVSLTLSDCLVSRNGGFGVSVTNGGEVNVINSAIRENREGGLFYDESTSGEIIETSIEDNGRGVLAYSNDVSGFDNYLRGNGTPLVGNIDPSFRTNLRPAEDEQILYSRERYPSLQHAVDSLKPGGKLFITSGEYEEGVTVDKEITLVSMDSSFVILDPAREFATGISVIDGGDLTVRNIQLSGGSTGMTVGRNGRVNASRMNFYNNLNGVILLNNARGTITDSQLYFNCYAGIIAYDSSQLQVVGNDFFINWVGVIAKPPGEYSGRIDGWDNEVNCKNTFLNVPPKTRDRLLSETRPEDNSGPDEENKSE